uniref:Uncharacterized protein n=1 Tax=Tanacetum cinerariifolium TaxID=118510 RepID=A0A6L2KWC0_TANCI|nr:hypothetical protein [Tanacetum cinerariifolium]
MGNNPLWTTRGFSTATFYEQQDYLHPRLKVVNGALASVLKLKESTERFCDPARAEIWEIHFIPFSPLKARTKIWEIHFIPFSPLEKRTVLTYINGCGS